MKEYKRTTVLHAAVGLLCVTGIQLCFCWTHFLSPRFPKESPVAQIRRDRHVGKHASKCCFRVKRDQLDGNERCPLRAAPNDAPLPADPAPLTPLMTTNIFINLRTSADYIFPN